MAGRCRTLRVPTYGMVVICRSVVEDPGVCVIYPSRTMRPCVGRWSETPTWVCAARWWLWGRWWYGGEMSDSSSADLRDGGIAERWRTLQVPTYRGWSALDQGFNIGNQVFCLLGQLGHERRFDFQEAFIFGKIALLVCGIQNAPLCCRPA